MKLVTAFLLLASIISALGAVVSVVPRDQHLGNVGQSDFGHAASGGQFESKSRTDISSQLSPRQGQGLSATRWIYILLRS
jgi:hypothetical protein